MDCTHCAREAAHYLTIDSPYDPCCQDCFEALFFACERCHTLTLMSEREDVCVSRQTRSEPAEYADWCANCANPPEPDCDDVGE